MSNHLSSIIGQKRVIDTLQKFINSQNIPHAILFSGTRNVGQHHVAKQFLKELLSINNPEKNYSLKIDKLEEPFIKYVIPLPRGKSETPDDMPLAKLTSADLEELKEELDKKINNPFYEISLEKANNIKINSIREIKKYLTINYDELPYRLVIIEDAHLMSGEAQNALLKSLEEPPNGVIFILITDKPDMLLTTTKSRCWELPFTSLSDGDIEYILINSFKLDIQEVKKVIPFANGSIHRVFVLLNYGFENLLEATINILRYSMGKKYNTVIKLINTTIDENPKAIVPILIELMITWFNDVQKAKAGIENIQFAQYEDTIQKFISKFNDVELDEIIFKLTNLSKNIDYNVNLNLLILNIIFNLSALSKR